MEKEKNGNRKMKIMEARKEKKSSDKRNKRRELEGTGKWEREGRRCRRKGRREKCRRWRGKWIGKEQARQEEEKQGNEERK